jgi:hypothetical protein
LIDSTRRLRLAMRIFAGHKPSDPSFEEVSSLEELLYLSADFAGETLPSQPMHLFFPRH